MRIVKMRDGEFEIINTETEFVHVLTECIEIEEGTHHCYVSEYPNDAGMWWTFWGFTLVIFVVGYIAGKTAY